METYELLALSSAIAAIIGAGGSLIASLVQASIQKRRDSGTVETSDAQTLFNYSTQIINTLSTMTHQLWSRIDTVIIKIEATHSSIENVIDRLERLIEIHEQRAREERPYDRQP